MSDRGAGTLALDQAAAAVPGRAWEVRPDVPMVAFIGDGRDHLVSDGWTVVGAAVAGPSHRRRDRPGDDALAVGINRGRLVGIVADGAGSASHGRTAAEITSRAMIGALLADPSADGERGVIRAIEQVRAMLTQAAAVAKAKLEDFRTTLVGALVEGSDGFFFHIGDGAAMALGPAEASGAAPVLAFSPAESGEYAGETVFVSDGSWRSHLRFTPFSRASRVVLMSDGVTPFALERDGSAPAWPFLAPVNLFLAAHPASVGARALERLLERDDARRVSGDDKALLWAALDPDSPAASGANDGS